MKKVCVLMGSPRLNGNTAELLKPFMAHLTENDCAVEYITLHNKEIKPCGGCFACQHVAGEYGCVIKDNVDSIMNAIITSDCVIFATPIYTWFCTAPMKALLDRHFGLNKFYGKAPRESLWEGKSVGIVATHGYDQAHACQPFEMAIQRLCKHSKTNYIGMYSFRDEDDLASFKTDAAVTGIIRFADAILKE
ncbi:MAG: flavodoxin family protein [Defluviitaleaceae bacterium]|nr:flavodoxin family protein [Defluviitaleaceae bacterium]